MEIISFSAFSPLTTDDAECKTVVAQLAAHLGDSGCLIIQ